ncbi:hypothetical protein ACJ6WF_30990 [Streptomyces sp. MMS24-I2-30]|uniref:hypothetical protein n=1 Tax=Streptomyces sp. MMS24-I2-30 TaxID=3351564 RepID=UPI003896D341
MPELVFFSGTMDCGKSTDFLGYSPFECCGVGGVLVAGGGVVCVGEVPAVRCV